MRPIIMRSFNDGMTVVRDAFAVETDDDFELPSVVRRKASPRPQQKRNARKAERKAGMGERLMALALKHPSRIVASVFLTGCAGAIVWNALLLQSTRHPAPLFSHRNPAVAAAPAPVPDPTRPLPPARPAAGAPEAQAMAVEAYEPSPPVEAAPPSPAVPASRSAISDLIRNNGVPAPAPHRPQQAAAAPAPAPALPPSRAQTVRDPIAEMIRLGGPVPTPPANVGKADGGDLVLAGQRALARLGYGVKVDGMMGPGTRQAIERFEQDRRLPVTGTFSSRTVRELSSLSGIAVQ